MPLIYKQFTKFRDAHNEPIIALAISKTGKYFASGSVDSKLCIWSFDSPKPMFSIRGQGAFLSICWIGDCILVAGMEDGVLLHENISVTCFPIHTAPIECLDTLGMQIASGAHGELAVWAVHPSYETPKQCIHLRKFYNPPTAASNRSDPIVVTTVQWIDENQLLVAYLAHGVMIWGVSQGQVVRTMLTTTIGGNAGISPDHRWLAVSSHLEGVDVYEVHSMNPSRRYVAQLDSKKVTPSRFKSLIFAHNGSVIIHAAGLGAIAVSHLSSQKILQMVSHNDDSRILALAAHYHAPTDEFLLITAGSPLNGLPYILLWKCQEMDQNKVPQPQSQETRQGEPQGEKTLGNDASKNHSFIFFALVFVFSVGLGVSLANIRSFLP